MQAQSLYFFADCYPVFQIEEQTVTARPNLLDYLTSPNSSHVNTEKGRSPVPKITSEPSLSTFKMTELTVFTTEQATKISAELSSQATTAHSNNIDIASDPTILYANSEETSASQTATSRNSVTTTIPLQAGEVLADTYTTLFKPTGAEQTETYTEITTEIIESLSPSTPQLELYATTTQSSPSTSETGLISDTTRTASLIDDLTSIKDGHETMTTSNSPDTTNHNTLLEASEKFLPYHGAEIERNFTVSLGEFNASQNNVVSLQNLSQAVSSPNRKVTKSYLNKYSGPKAPSTIATIELPRSKQATTSINLSSFLTDTEGTNKSSFPQSKHQSQPPLSSNMMPATTDYPIQDQKTNSRKNAEITVIKTTQSSREGGSQSAEQFQSKDNQSLLIISCIIVLVVLLVLISLVAYTLKKLNKRYAHYL